MSALLTVVAPVGAVVSYVCVPVFRSAGNDGVGLLVGAMAIISLASALGAAFCFGCADTYWPDKGAK